MGEAGGSDGRKYVGECSQVKCNEGSMVKGRVHEGTAPLCSSCSSGEHTGWRCQRGVQAVRITCRITVEGDGVAQSLAFVVAQSSACPSRCGLPAERGERRASACIRSTWVGRFGDARVQIACVTSHVSVEPCAPPRSTRRWARCTPRSARGGRGATSSSSTSSGGGAGPRWPRCTCRSECARGWCTRGRCAAGTRRSAGVPVGYTIAPMHRGTWGSSCVVTHVVKSRKGE